MKNVVVFGLAEDNAKTAICMLQQNKIINIKAWLNGTKNSDKITKSYNELLLDSTLKDTYEICDKEVYDKVYKKIYFFLDMVYRNGDQPIYEYVNIFNMWINYYYKLFKENKVEIVIFSDNPHFGVDSIAKDVADAMGIKAIMFMQSSRPNKFWAFSDIDDIGMFDTLKNDNVEIIEVEKKHEKDLFYMKEINAKYDNNIIEKLYLMFKATTNIIISSMDKVVNLVMKKEKDIYIRMILKSYNTIYKKIRRFYCEKLYNLNLCKNYTKVNINSDYVYFPLHMQPEMTTSVLGKEYCDQLLAIERLSELIPDTWSIYVKENPKQTYYMREENFFKRLSLIPKTKLVEKKCNTYELIKKSKFVATISGTAGWEAISGGKNVLIFGLAWYRSLPGVFEYKNNFKLEEILAYKLTHEELQKKYNDLMGKAYDGVLECGYEVIVGDYTNTRNNELLYEAFLKILCRI